MDAGDWDRRWEERALHAAGLPSEVVVREVTALEPGTALDLACGAGRHAVWLAERGWQVTAVDFSAVALEQARGRADAAGTEVEWIQSDALDYDPEPGAFDLVLVAYLHVPAEERRRILARAAAAVASGGTLVLVGHDRDNIVTGAPGPTNPALLYGPEEVARELPGLRVQRAVQATRQTELDDGTMVDAIDAVVVATRR